MGLKERNMASKIVTNNEEEELQFKRTKTQARKLWVNFLNLSQHRLVDAEKTNSF